MPTTRRLPLPIALACAALLYACEVPQGVDVEQRYPDKGRVGKGANNPEYGPPPSVLGEGGFNIFGGGSKRDRDEGGAGIGVNAFLWRASLDTVSFMPLTSADPFGGVIITDWYVPPEAPDERFKVNVYILDRQLRADGVRVAVFKQARGADGNWHNADVEAAVGAELENKILARARELRVAVKAP